MVSPATTLGWRGEEAARGWLERRGFVFLAKNFRTRYGELDLVMRHGKLTVFVEVKLRRNRKFGLPEESIGPRKLERLQAAVEAYCQKNPAVQDVRLDLVVVELINNQWTIRHLPGIG